ncbi:hypothetical protein HanRHA438_Chr03g0144191 [Helianthus annuus]|nr:hypothetical protein HanRHA438_Chr03g0144191 [Helianthus annuus]
MIMNNLAEFSWAKTGSTGFFMRRDRSVRGFAPNPASNRRFFMKLGVLQLGLLILTVVHNHQHCLNCNWGTNCNDLRFQN